MSAFSKMRRGITASWNHSPLNIFGNSISYASGSWAVALLCKGELLRTRGGCKMQCAQMGFLARGDECASKGTVKVVHSHRV